MAISRVRVQINGAWYPLAYNSTTGKYEAGLTFAAISSSQPGGYFPATVEGALDDGYTATLSGAVYPGLRLVVEDTVAPTLAVTAPADGLITAAASLTVSGTAYDSSGLSSVTVNGVAATMGADNSWSAAVSLSEGVNTITVEAVDTSGNVSTETLTVTLDTVPPEIAITAPTAGQMVSSAAFTVEGTVGDSGSGVAEITVNGQTATVLGGTFSRALTLTEGVNAITAVAADAAGNTATAVSSVLLDTIPPELTVASPAGDLITNNPALTVAGTASDGGSGLAKVTVNSVEVPVSGGAYSLEITLAEGQNTVIVTAIDLVGNETTITRAVLLDTQDPVITLVSPPEGFINNSNPTVTFSAIDEPGGSGVDTGTVKVYLDNALQTNVTVSGGEISFTPSLSDGAHVITVTLDDIAGNQRGLSVTYTVDTAPPEMRLLKPYMRHVVDVEAIEITVEATDAGTGVASVTAGGYALTGDGEYSGRVPLEIGENSIIITATDRAGNAVDTELFMIRLVTDRTQADIARLNALYQRPGEWTADELEWFNSAACLRGSYDVSDWNRVGAAVEWLAGELWRRGYAPEVSPKTDWVEQNNPVRGPMETYRQNVAAVRDAQRGLVTTPLPATMRHSGIGDWNNIEKALVEVDAVFPGYFAWTAGEISAGE